MVKFQQFPCGSQSKRIRHAVTEILAAFGPRLEDRPPVMSKEEQERRLQEVEERQKARKEKREVAKRQIAIDRIALRLHNRQLAEAQKIGGPGSNI